MVGIEIAQSDPKVVYLAMYGYPGRHPALARSTDGGSTWETADVEAALGANEFRILAVDPDDADLVYLRVVAPTQEEVWTTRDGGQTFERVVVVANGQLQAFARLASGTVLVGTSTNLAGGGAAGGGYRSVDGGHTFVPWTLCPQPHIIGLAERAGTLYIAGKNYSDGWALATSTDEGLTLTPLSTYDQVRGVLACAASTCAAACAYEVTTAVWPGAVCSGELADAGSYPPGPRPSPVQTAEPVPEARPEDGRRREVLRLRLRDGRAAGPSRSRRRARDAARRRRRVAPPSGATASSLIGVCLTCAAFRRRSARQPRGRSVSLVLFVHGVSVQGWAHSSAVRAGGS